MQYGGPRGMVVPQQQLSMPRNGPVPPFPGAQAGFVAQQMFGGFGQPSLGAPSFAQLPQQQQVAGYGGMGGLGGGPFGAAAPSQAYPSDEHPSEWGTCPRVWAAHLLSQQAPSRTLPGQIA